MNRLKTLWVYVFFLFYCASTSWGSDSVLTWDATIIYRNFASSADKSSMGNKLRSSMLYNINTRSELKLRVGKQSLIAKIKLPFQSEPPVGGSLSKVGWSEYYAFFDSTTHIVAYGEITSVGRPPTAGETIAINEAIIWKPSEHLFTKGSPSGYYTSVWMPSLIFLCYLAHQDIDFIERLSGVKFDRTAKEGKRVYTYAKNNVAIRIFYRGNFPEKMEIDDIDIGATVRVVSEGRFSEKPIGNPYRVRYIDTGGGSYKYKEVVLTLKQVETLDSEESPELDFPLGTYVSDYRLLGANLTQKQIREWDRSVQYRWAGRLPTEEELRRLAYQHGNLLPPETPRRRYSLWMFVPAIALFGLALLLYLRRKKT